MLLLANAIVLGILGLLSGISIFFPYQKARKQNISIEEWGKGWLADFSTEMAGAFLTALLFGLIVGFVQETESQNNLKTQLILQLRNTDNSVAFYAAQQLENFGWLTDGSLERAFIWEANLEDVDLSSAYMPWASFYGSNMKNTNFAFANLSNADMGDAILIDANLYGANLSNAYIYCSNLQEASLPEANLQGARLTGSNFSGANLGGANLSGANLTDSVLENARFEGIVRGVLVNASFDETTILPDGSFWTQETNMARFTDPSHPNFWQGEVCYETTDNE